LLSIVNFSIQHLGKCLSVKSEAQYDVSRVCGLLAIDADGGREAARAAGPSGASLWAGKDVFTPREQEQLRANGLSLTVFDYSLRGAKPEVFEAALATVEEHHPDHTIWAQHVS
jgi:hypothetical protein